MNVINSSSQDNNSFRQSPKKNMKNWNNIAPVLRDGTNGPYRPATAQITKLPAAMSPKSSPGKTSFRSNK